MNENRTEPGAINPTSRVAREAKTNKTAGPAEPTDRRLPWARLRKRNHRFAVLLLFAGALLLLLSSSLRRMTPSDAPSAQRPIERFATADARLNEARWKPEQKESAAAGRPWAAQQAERMEFEPSPSVNSRPHAEYSHTDPMIARSVSLRLMARDFTHARTAMDELLVRHHGYAAELTVSAEQANARSLQASLRIPAGDLAAALEELKTFGKVENESQKGEDVSPQHTDLVARLKNALETERRLQSILEQRTGKMSDVLEVEQEISRVRGELERMEAEREGLEHRVEFATVELRIEEEFHAQLGTPSLKNRLRNAVVNGFQGAADALVGILLFALTYGPTLLLWLLILFLPVRFLWKRSQEFRHTS